MEKKYQNTKENFCFLKNTKVIFENFPKYFFFGNISPFNYIQETDLLYYVEVFTRERLKHARLSPPAHTAHIGTRDRILPCV